jgi:hypothetical protein
MGTLIKNYFFFEKKIDFDFISNLLDRNNFETTFSSNWMQNSIFESVFKIKGVESDLFFKDIFYLLNKNYNKENKKSDLFIFFSMVSGNKGTSHRDDYDVVIIGLYGKTFYKIENEYFMLEPNDLLIIPKNKLHKAIGLTPRICLSYGIY